MSLVSLFVGIAATSVVVQHYYPNSGEISQASLELWLENEFILNNTAINWDVCEPGYTYYFENMTVLNTGNTALTVYITPYDLPSDWLIEWEGDNTPLAPGGTAQGWLNLTIPDTATTWPTWGFKLNGDDGT